MWGLPRGLPEVYTKTLDRGNGFSFLFLTMWKDAITDSSDDTPFAVYAFRGPRETTVWIFHDNGGKDDASFLWVITTITKGDQYLTVTL